MARLLRNSAKSWRTTTVAILAAVTAALSAASALLDADPATMPDWQEVVTLIIIAGGLLFARDADDDRPGV